MCNICGGRLFLVPNPCCCCDLRCGVIWSAFSDVILGLVSMGFLTTLDEVETERLAEQRNHGSLDTIFFILSGFMIICASYGMGSHNFSRFLLSCTWLFIRAIIIAVLLARASYMIDHHGPVKRYGIFISLHVLLDVYLFIVIRYYSMECFDAYRYERIINSTRIRRLLPLISKSAPKTRSEDKDKEKQKQSSGKKRATQIDLERNTNILLARNAFQKRRDSEVDINAHAERIPVWDRKNEVIFYGENYTEWDPTLFMARWELLNEKDPNKAEVVQVSIKQEIKESEETDEKKPVATSTATTSPADVKPKEAKKPQKLSNAKNKFSKQKSTSQPTNKGKRRQSLK